MFDESSRFSLGFVGLGDPESDTKDMLEGEQAMRRGRGGVTEFEYYHVL